MNIKNKKGITVNSKDVLCGRDKGQEFFPRFNFNINNKDLSPEFIISNPEELPKRFHMILTYQKDEGMPGFIVDGPIPYTTPGIKSRWLPLFGGGSENFIIISNRSIGSEKPSTIKFKMYMYNNFNLSVYAIC